jgi:hypothetical protein
MTLLLVALAGFAADDPDVKEPKLRAELVGRMKADQDVRRELQKVAPPNQPLTVESRARPEVKDVLDRMVQIDRDNLAWFKKVVEEHGWPGYALVGQDGAQAAFLIAQHATSDLEFMRKCLGLLTKAHEAGDAKGEWVALMTDRQRTLREKKKQLYGTQLTTKGGKLVPLPIEDEAKVDERRKALGMPPLAEYLKFVNDRAGGAKKE